MKSHSFAVQHKYIKSVYKSKLIVTHTLEMGRVHEDIASKKCTHTHIAQHDNN